MTGFKRAQRTQVKIKALVMGPSGAGKTLGALKLGEGIATGADRLALIDSENDRSGYYADAVAFDALSLSEHTPKAYMAALQQAVDAGYEVVIMDSLTHAWQNVLDRKEAYDRQNPRSNSFTNWKIFSAEWEKLVRAILDAPIHVIATARSKQAYEQTEQDGKKKVTKMGMAPIIREGTEYEFALVFDVLPSHKAQAVKDNTGKFDMDDTKLWDLCDGTVVKELKAWMAGAKPAAPKVTAASMTLTQAEDHIVRGRRVGDLDGKRLAACLAWATGENDALAVRACEIVMADRQDAADSDDPDVELLEGSAPILEEEAA
jgi:hypothetical protein